MRPRGLFHDFRRLSEGVQDLVLVLGDLLQVQRDAGPAVDRITALELSRHEFEAECGGVLLKADGKLKAANNAEQRERQLKRSYEAIVEELGEAGGPGPGASPVLPDDAEAGKAERVPALRLDVAPDPKAAALMAKWGR